MIFPRKSVQPQEGWGILIQELVKQGTFDDDLYEQPRVKLVMEKIVRQPRSLATSHRANLLRRWKQEVAIDPVESFPRGHPLLVTKSLSQQLLERFVQNHVRQNYVRQSLKAL